VSEEKKNPASIPEQCEDDFSKLMQADRLVTLGRLVAGVAHEIGNPLTGILTYAYLLRDSFAKDDPRREDLELIIQETLRCREIVRGLLDFARQCKLKRERVLVNEIVAKAVRLVEKQKEFKEVKIITELDPKIGEISADPFQIEQVVLNLVINAGEAMPKGGRIWVRTRSLNDGWVELEVEDEGVGIPAELKEVIFEPFFTTKKDQGGTGLGLSICYGIVKNHEGEIRLESELGRGTKFIVRFPKHSPKEESTP